ncbi:hypothetical protein [Persephonella sp.]
MIKKFVLIQMLILPLIFLISCGGGGGENNDPNTNTSTNPNTNPPTTSSFESFLNSINGKRVYIFNGQAQVCTISVDLNNKTISLTSCVGDSQNADITLKYYESDGKIYIQDPNLQNSNYPLVYLKNSIACIKEPLSQINKTIETCILSIPDPIFTKDAAVVKSEIIGKWKQYKLNTEGVFQVSDLCLVINNDNTVEYYENTSSGTVTYVIQNFIIDNKPINVLVVSDGSETIYVLPLYKEGQNLFVYKLWFENNNLTDASFRMLNSVSACQ